MAGITQNRQKCLIFIVAPLLKDQKHYREMGKK